MDAEQIRVGVTGKLLAAPVGTVFPATTGAPWTGFTELGYVTEDGPGITPSTEKTDIGAWQATQPVRSIITERGIEWAAALMETTGSVLKLAFGGGTVTDIGGGDYKFTPPGLAEVDERAFGLEVQDGTIVARWRMYRGLVTDVDQIPFKKDEATTFGITITNLVPTSGDPWDLISNDPAMAL